MDNRGREPFTGTEARKELLKSFSSMYLTWMSMIQGAVFAYTVFKFFETIQDLSLSSTQKVNVILYFILSLGILALIWYDYLYNHIFLRLPNILDAIYPLAFGTLQAGMATSLNNSFSWLGFTLGVGLVAILAYTNTRKGTVNEMHRIEESERVYSPRLEHVFQTVQIEKIITTMLMFIIVGAAYTLHLIKPALQNQKISIVINSIFFIVLGYMLFLSSQITSRLFMIFHKISRNDYAESLLPEIRPRVLNHDRKVPLSKFELNYLQNWARKFYKKHLKRPTEPEREEFLSKYASDGTNQKASNL